MPMMLPWVPKTILAHKPGEQRNDIGRKARSPRDHRQDDDRPRHLREDLPEICEGDYNINDEGHHDGLRCLAAPVFGNGDCVFGDERRRLSEPGIRQALHRGDPTSPQGAGQRCRTQRHLLLTASGAERPWVRERGAQ
ncbi:hypothetical protein EGH23_19325 [Halomicroarcula sp. F27]|uniref:IclR-ED domain-containing protein n=1 Tax=Haloarcula nitratireducens TaxID=2487749 RepID=A0AAW4PHH6_9EURY|nr:hypothetical protein [Halomicroarcula nitratireducens]